jgi:cytosine/adenosine deaminase-related metal-dependent hydrolase
MAKRDDVTPPEPRDPDRRNLLLASLLAGAAGLSAASAQAAPAQTDIKKLQNAKRYLVKNAIILTVDSALGDFEKADMLVENGKIKAIAPNLSVSSETLVVDGTNRILIPGFVDTHSHSYQGLLRGLLPNGVVLPDYDRDIQKNITPHYTANDAYQGVLITALGFLDLGTTSMIDISQVSHSRTHVDANIQALKDSGMRAVYAMSRGIGEASQYPDGMKTLLPSYFSSQDQLITPALAVSVEKETFLSARQYGLKAVLHIRVNSAPLISLSQAGVLSEGDLFVHCAHLNKDAWKIIHDTGGRTSHSPVVEMAMGHGYPAIQDALDAGARPSLSCDHAATVGMDMFGMMRAVFDIQRLAIQQRQRNGEKETQKLLTCKEVLQFATLNGARAAGLDHKIGSLTPGKEADFLMLRADDLSIWPLNNAYSAAVNLMSAGHIEGVFVAGKVKKWQGRLLNVDKTKVLREVAQSRDNVLRKAKFAIGLTA